jgi:hypothetical protein
MSLLRQSPSGGPAHSPSSEQGGGAAADWPVSSPASSSSRLGVVHSSPASPAPQGPLSLNSMQIALMALKVRVARTSKFSSQPVFRVRRNLLRIQICGFIIRIADLDAAGQFNYRSGSFAAIFVAIENCEMGR